MMKMLLAVGFFVVVTMPVRADHEKMVGTWTVTSEEKDGKQQTADQIQGKQVKITRDTLAVTGSKDEKENMTARFEIDTGAKPYRIVFTCTEGEHKGKKVKGIAQLEGEDTLRICFAKPDEDAPTDFKTKANQCSVTLKRSGR